MKRLLTIAFIFISTILSAQSEYESYTWNTIPAQNQSDTIKSVDGTVILLERRITEVYVNSKDMFEEIFVFHKKIKVETHKALDEQKALHLAMLIYLLVFWLLVYRNYAAALAHQLHHQV